MLPACKRPSTGAWVVSFSGAKSLGGMCWIILIVNMYISSTSDGNGALFISSACTSVHTAVDACYLHYIDDEIGS